MSATVIITCSAPSGDAGICSTQRVLGEAQVRADLEVSPLGHDSAALDAARRIAARDGWTHRPNAGGDRCPSHSGRPPHRPRVVTRIR